MNYLRTTSSVVLFGFSPSFGKFVFISIRVDWKGLGGFESMTNQNLYYFFLIPSNLFSIEITEQGFNGLNVVLFSRFSGMLITVCDTRHCRIVRARTIRPRIVHLRRGQSAIRSDQTD